jgi:hypothetical protein
MVPITEAMGEYFSDLPITTGRAIFERAVHRALDAEGWPAGPRGEIAIAISYWFVNLWNRFGELHGHVGPIHDITKAETCATSWRNAGMHARVSRDPLGVPLTNEFKIS